MTQLAQWLQLLFDTPLSALGFLLLLAMSALLWRAAPAQTTRAPRAFQSIFGAGAWPAPLFRSVVALWLLLATFILFGIFHSISEFIGIAPSGETEAKADLRFLLTRMAALVAVLSAVIAFPFTVIRLKLATEENSRATEALYNDKINAALDDLHAMRQRTLARDEGILSAGKTIWEADVTRRNGAIDRLEALAHEYPKDAPRIARTLCTYLKELSREYPAKEPPENATLDELRKWAQALTPARSDMESAAQTLGRLHEVEGVSKEKLGIDLSGANLQGFDLTGVEFHHAKFERTHLDGANLEASIFFDVRFLSASMIFGNLRNTTHFSVHFNNCIMIGTDIWFSALQETLITGSDIEGAHFDDSSFIGVSISPSLEPMATRPSFKSAYFDNPDFGPWLLNELDIRSAAFRNWRPSNGDMENVTLTEVFGDASNVLPNDEPLPDHWPNTVLKENKFFREWERFKRNPGAYVPPQNR